MLNKLFPHGSKRRKIFQKIYFESLVPSRLSKNYIQLDSYQITKLKESYVQNLFLNSQVSHEEINDHFDSLENRQRDHRIKIIPWIDSVRNLNGLRILEIGCGSGTSTVALAEQGANMTAIDVNENLLNDAKNRCEIYNLEVDFHLMNARDVSKLLSHNQYDMIIFYAVLEHMTYEERMIALKETFQMIPGGALWIVIDTPNRLHHYDSHTSMMPFYHCFLTN